MSLAADLATSLRGISGKLKRRLREHGAPNDFTPSQVAVVLYLEQHGPATVSTLARAEGMRPQSMSSAVTPLLQANFVASAPHPTDGRGTLLSLTPHCIQFLAEGRAARQDWLASTITAKLTPAEQAQLHAALPLLARVVED